jgi:hypothetical protein
MTAQQRHSVFDVAGLPRLKEVIGGESWNVAVIQTIRRWSSSSLGC